MNRNLWVLALSFALSLENVIPGGIGYIKSGRKNQKSKNVLVIRVTWLLGLVSPRIEYVSTKSHTHHPSVMQIEEIVYINHPPTHKPTHKPTLPPTHIPTHPPIHTPTRPPTSPPTNPVSKLSTYQYTHPHTHTHPLTHIKRMHDRQLVYIVKVVV